MIYTFCCLLTEPRNGGSVGWALAAMRTNTQGLKINEEKVLPLQLHENG